MDTSLRLLSLAEKLQKFDGEKSKYEAWEETLEATASLGKLQNDETPIVASQTFIGPAEVWYRISKENPEIHNLDRWEPEPARPAVPADPDNGIQAQAAVPARPGGLKAAMRDRFLPQQTPTEANQAYLKEAFQRPGEKAEEFFDRIRLARSKLTRATYTQQFLTENRVTMTRVFKVNLMTALHVGLLNCYKDFLKTNDSEALNEPEELIKLCVKFESTDQGAEQLKRYAKLPAAHHQIMVAPTLAAFQVESTPTPESGQQQKPKGAAATRPSCQYCALKSHSMQQCWFASADRNMGIFRDTVEGYPLTPKKARSKMAKLKKAAAANSSGAPVVPQPGLHQQQQAFANVAHAPLAPPSPGAQAMSTMHFHNASTPMPNLLTDYYANSIQNQQSLPLVQYAQQPQLR